MKMMLAVALGGALGAVARYKTVAWTAQLVGFGFPWGVLLCNVAGSYVMGAFVETLALRFDASHELRAFVAIGLLGAFTTFSSFALDVANLYQNQRLMEAAAYISASVSLSIFGLFAGLWVARTVLS